MLYKTPTLLVPKEVCEQLSYCTRHMWEHSNKKIVILIMGSHGKLYEPIETKYLDVRPRIPILKTTFGDAQYRVG